MSAADQLEHLRLAAEVAGLGRVEPALPTQNHLNLGDLRLHYLDWGTAARPPIVFLHGGGLTARTWDLVCLSLRSDYRCLALDQRGHGDSDWSDELDYDLTHHARDLRGFITELGLKRPILVGQSLGGMNALTYAARHPREVSALALIDVVLAVRVDALRAFVAQVL